MKNVAILISGGGSNMLVADRGLRALVIQLDNQQCDASSHGEDVLVAVGAGHDWDQLVSWTVAQGFAGLECLAGIPGRVGAAPMQNIGAYGQEVSQSIEWVELLDRESGKRTRFDNHACGFAYRHSVFKERLAGRYIVWRVCFRLRPGGAPLIAYPELQRALAEHGSPSLAHTRETVVRLRRRKSMVLDSNDDNHRSAGSFFVNPILGTEHAAKVGERAATLLQAGERMPSYPMADGRIKLPAAWLIERAGMPKGFGDGAVGLSSRHTLAVVNRGSATAAEIVAFASDVRRRVHDRFGVALSHEPRLLGFQPHEVTGLTANL